MPGKTMTISRCPCGQPSPDAAICRACTRTLQLALITAITIAPDLDIAIARQSVFATTSGHGKGNATPLPYDEHAAEAAWVLRDTIAAWHRQAIGPIPDAALPAMALALLHQAAVIRLRPDAYHCMDEITMAVQRATRAIDRPPQRAYAGPCNCGADLLAKHGQTMVTCRSCGTEHTISERQQLLRDQLDDYLGNAAWCATIATALGSPVQAATIRKWAQRGKLTQRPGGLYRAGDVMDLATRAMVRSA